MSIGVVAERPEFGVPFRCYGASQILVKAHQYPGICLFNRNIVLILFRFFCQQQALVRKVLFDIIEESYASTTY